MQERLYKVVVVNIISSTRLPRKWEAKAKRDGQETWDRSSAPHPPQDPATASLVGERWWLDMHRH